MAREKREHRRIVEVGGVRYRVTDFDPFSGGFVFLFVIRKIVPLLKAMDVDITGLLTMEANQGLGQIVEIIIPVLDSISQEDLQKFMELCLQQVEIDLPAGYEPVMRGGEFTVDEVKYSLKTAFVLCYHAIEGILKDFFGEEALGSIFTQNPKATKR